MTISLCMIVRNEEAVLVRCLESIAHIVDEIIIVDTGSNDGTKEIARKYTDKVFDFEWTDDFSAARNYAFSKARMDYQMWLDADDVLPETEHEKFLLLKDSLPQDVDMVTMKYITHFDENGNPLLYSTRERLLRRKRGYLWQDPVHECIPLSGNILYGDICIWHKKQPSEKVSTRNLEIYEKLETEGKDFTPRQLYYYARELKDHARWDKAASCFERFLDGGKGWYEDNIEACLCLGVCYRQLNQNDKILPSLLRSFLYDSPRAEVCCEIGYFHKWRYEYEKALSWFDIATKLIEPSGAGFRLADSRGYIPNVECCVCSCMLGKYEQANRYNEAAAILKPESEAVLHNREYIAQFLAT